MMRRARPVLLTAGVLLAAVLSLAVYVSLRPQTAVSNQLGIDASRGRVITHFDTHGSFGDGTAYTVLSFSGNQVLEQIKASASWEAFPLEEPIKTFVYGASDGTSAVRYGLFVRDKFGNPLVPEIQNGYYRLIDRHRDRDAEPDILKRASFNFSLALYDTGANTLYYWELDT